MTASVQNNEDRAAQLVEKYRGRRKRTVDFEAIDRFAERVFGTDKGYQVLIDYLHGDLDTADEELAEDGQPRLPPRAR